jgi:hypothetical protein
MADSRLPSLEAWRASNDPVQLLRAAGVNVPGALIQGQLESLAMLGTSSAGGQNHLRPNAAHVGQPSQEDVHAFVREMVSAGERDRGGLTNFFRYVVRGGAAPAVADYMIREQGCDITELVEGRSLDEIAGSKAMLNVLFDARLELARTGKLKPFGSEASSASSPETGGDAPKSKGPSLGM